MIKIHLFYINILLAAIVLLYIHNYSKIYSMYVCKKNIYTAAALLSCNVCVY